MARLLRLKKQPETFAVQGVARVDRRTKDMIPRLQEGEIAIINHRDLDRVAADGLIEKGVVAVVNCAQSISGRYPNGGPIRVVERGHHAARRRGSRADGPCARRRRRSHRAG